MDTLIRCPQATLLTPILILTPVGLLPDLILTVAVDVLPLTLVCHQWEPLASLLTPCTTPTMPCTATACHQVCHLATPCHQASLDHTEGAQEVVTVADLLGQDPAADLPDTDPLVTEGTDLLPDTHPAGTGLAQGPLPLVTVQATPLAAGPVTLVELALPPTVLVETTLQLTVAPCL